MARTERADYRATVKERNPGQTPFLMFEPMHDNMPFLDNVFVCLELRDGTTLEQAEELARQIHARAKGLSITTFR